MDLDNILYDSSNSYEAIGKEKKLQSKLEEILWQCGICKETFQDEALILFHQTQAHPGIQHECKCAVCGQNFTDESSKNCHLKKLHLRDSNLKINDGKEKIEDVGNSHKSNKEKIGSEESKEHVLFLGGQFDVHSGELQSSPYKCNFCSTTFKFLQTLICHLKATHNISNQLPMNDVLKSESGDDFQSNIQRIVRRQSKLKIIVKKTAVKRKANIEESLEKPQLQGILMNNERNPKILKCILCPHHIPVSRLRDLQTHLTVHHPNYNRTSTDCVQCLSCSEIKCFKSLKSLSRHLAKCHDQVYQPFRCHFCSYGTKSKNDLDHHKLRMHSTRTRAFKCGICNTKFFQSEDFQNHLLRSHNTVDKSVKVSQDIEGMSMINEFNPLAFACLSCAWSTSSFDQLVTHCQNLHLAQDNQNLSCLLCEFMCPKLAQLKNHVRVNHSQEFIKFRCDHCSFGAWKSRVLLHHKLQVHPELPHLKCKACFKKVFYSNDDLEAHLKNCEAYSNCSKCGKIFQSRSILKKHRTVCLRYANLTSEDENFKCSICNLTFKTIANLNEHHASVHGGPKPYVCDGCGLSFSRKNNITKHKKTGACKGFQHVDETDDVDNKFKCNQCEKTFKYKQSYNQHMEWIHLGQKKNQCEDCGQLFSQVHHLRKHRVKVHNHIMPHVCTVCNNRFVSATQWKTHMKRYHEIDVITNTTEKNSEEDLMKIEDENQSPNEEKLDKKIMISGASKKCPACPFQTPQAADLQDHIDLTHDSRPYKCKKCGTAFKKSYHLKAHDTEVHIGIRPHVCETCGFSFARQSNLLKHQRNKACPSIKPGGKFTSSIRGNPVTPDSNNHFLCHQCDKSFKYRQSLQYHIESIHMDKKNFACQFCGRGFTRMQRLREHSARMHGDGLVPPNHSCSECKREFITSGAYKLHMRKFHSIIITEQDEISPHNTNDFHQKTIMEMPKQY